MELVKLKRYKDKITLQVTFDDILAYDKRKQPYDT